MIAKISRHYSRDHIKEINIETKLVIYEDQVRGWFLDQARILEKTSEHSDFIILLIVLSFIEGHAIFMKGEDSENKSRKFFIETFSTIFSPSNGEPFVVDYACKELYKQLRCGLFHTGMVRGKIVLTKLSNSPIVVEFAPSKTKIISIKIDPHQMLNNIEDYFSRYMMRLRDQSETQLRENFEKAWNNRESSSM